MQRAQKKTKEKNSQRGFKTEFEFSELFLELTSYINFLYFFGIFFSASSAQPSRPLRSKNPPYLNLKTP